MTERSARNACRRAADPVALTERVAEPGVPEDLLQPRVRASTTTGALGHGARPTSLHNEHGCRVALEVTDLLYAETQEPLRKMIAGKTVEVIGQFIPGATHDQFKLVRIFLWCCAADARPIYIPVALSDPVDVSDMEWVKVTGTAEFSTNEGQTHVLLKADSVDPSDPPEEAMLY